MMNHEGPCFIHLTWSTWLKSTNVSVTSGQLDLSFMRWFTSKTLRQNSSGICVQSTLLFINSILCLLSILCLTVAIQIPCIIGRVKDILILSKPCFLHKTRTCSDKIMINVLLCWLTIQKTIIVFFYFTDFASSRAAIIVHFQTGNNQDHQKKIR